MTFGLAPADQPAIVIETPPRRALGDLAVPVAFELARRLRKAPRAIAQELAGAIGADRRRRAHRGRAERLSELLSGPRDVPAVASRRRRGAGPTPPARQGHRRAHGDQSEQGGAHRPSAERDARRHARAAAALPGTAGRSPELHRRHRRAGRRRRRRLHGARRPRPRGRPARSRTIRPRASTTTAGISTRKVTEWYAADKARLEIRAHAPARDRGRRQRRSRRMGAFIADRIVRCHLDDDGPDERRLRPAHVGGRHPAAAFLGDGVRAVQGARRRVPADRGPAEGLLGHADRGRRVHGCAARRTATTGANDDEPDEEAEQREKVIVRSNGTVTYVGKDIANQFWKFGLLGRDFHYRVFETRDGRPLWATTSAPTRRGRRRPPFGRAAAVYNVIDSRQAYLQQLLKQALATMGFAEQAAQSTHFAYEMVALSHATARDARLRRRRRRRQAVRRGVGPQGPRREGRRPARSADRRPRGREVALAQSGADAADVPRGPPKRSRSRPCATSCQVLARQGHRVRHRRGAELRGRDRPVPAVRRRARQQHLREAARARRRWTKPTCVARLAGARSRADRRRATKRDELWGLVLEAARLDEIVDARCARSSCRCSRSTRSAWRRRSTRSTTGSRSSRGARGRAALARRRRRLRAPAADAALDLMGCDVPARM